MSREIDAASDLELARNESLVAAKRAELKRIGTPDCEDCGSEIPTARRAAYPASTRCVPCASRREHQRKQYAGRR